MAIISFYHFRFIIYWHFIGPDAPADAIIGADMERLSVDMVTITLSDVCVRIEGISTTGTDNWRQQQVLIAIHCHLMVLIAI